MLLENNDIEVLRQALIDYFGSAMGVNFLMAVSSVEKDKGASPQELIEIARDCGIDLSNFNGSEFER